MLVKEPDQQEHVAEPSAAEKTPQLWMLIPTFYPVVGGAQVQVLRVAKEFLTRGWDVRVLTRRAGYAGLHNCLPAEERIEGVPVTRIRSSSGKFGSLLYVVGGLWYLLRHGRGAIYHAHDVGAAGWLAVVAKVLLRGRSIVKLRSGAYCYTRRYLGHVGAGKLRWLLRLVDRVVVTNSEVEGLLRERSAALGRVWRVPNGLETSRFAPALPGEKRARREQLGLPTEGTLTLYVGRLDPIKGVDVLLNGWARTSPAVRSGAHLVIVGDGGERESLNALAARLGIDGEVVFAGESRKVIDYYGAADVFVLPSRTEGLSNALVEAMASRLPVVASNVGGAPDLIQEGRSGMLFRSESADDLAAALTSMLQSAERWVEFGCEARSRVKLCADFSLTVDRLDRMYRGLREHVTFQRVAS